MRLIGSAILGGCFVLAVLAFALEPSNGDHYALGFHIATGELRATGWLLLAVGAGVYGLCWIATRK
jgi:hypothetical protein